MKTLEFIFRLPALILLILIVFVFGAIACLAMLFEAKKTQKTILDNILEFKIIAEDIAIKYFGKDTQYFISGFIYLMIILNILR